MTPRVAEFMSNRGRFNEVRLLQDHHDLVFGSQQN